MRFKCVDITEDMRRYGLKNVTLMRDDGSAGMVMITGTGLVDEFRVGGVYEITVAECKEEKG